MTVNCCLINRPFFALDNASPLDANFQAHVFDPFSMHCEYSHYRFALRAVVETVGHVKLRLIDSPWFDQRAAGLAADLTSSRLFSRSPTHDGECPRRDRAARYPKPPRQAIEVRTRITVLLGPQSHHQRYVHRAGLDNNGGDEKTVQRNGSIHYGR